MSLTKFFYFYILIVIEKSFVIAQTTFLYMCYFPSRGKNVRHTMHEDLAFTRCKTTKGHLKHWFISQPPGYLSAV